MAKLHVVSVTVGEVDQPSSRVVGAYTDPNVANCVKQVAWGSDPTVTEVDVDFVDPDLLAEMYELGVKMPVKGYGGGKVSDGPSPYTTK